MVYLYTLILIKLWDKAHSWIIGAIFSGIFIPAQMPKSIFILVITLLVKMGHGFSQEQVVYQESKLPVTKLKEDFDILREALHDIQPSLYRYTTAGVMDAYLEKKEDELTGAMSEMEYFTFLKAIIARVGNGHSKITPSSAYLAHTEVNIKKFPIRIQITDGHAYAIQDFTPESKIAPGSEILSINGKPFAEIYATLLPTMPSDGRSLSYKSAKLAANFHYHYSYHFPNTPQFAVEVQAPGDRRPILARVMGLSDAVLDKAMVASRKKAFELKFVDRETAVMTIRNFSNKGIPEFLAQSFEALKTKQTQNLILDLRDNRGGRDSYGVDLFSYLAESPFRYYERMITQLAPEQDSIPLAPYFNQPRFLKDFTSLVSIDEQGRKIVLDPPAHFGFVKPGNVHSPRPHPFKGKVFVLINEMSFSVTSDFCAIAHDRQRATFIGRETGGSYYGNTSGYAVRLTLPNSKLRVTLNLIEYHNHIERNAIPYGRGLIPDFEVVPNPMDRYEGKDTELEFTLALIAGASK